MSGISEETICPICGNNMATYTDWKPFNNASNECIHCGFVSYTKVEQMSLEEINERREEYNNDYEPDTLLKPLKQKDLDKYKKDIKNI